MKPIIMVLASAVLVASALTSAAEARSGVSDGARLSRASADFESNGSGVRPTSDSAGRRCYFPTEWPELPPWPPFCN